MRLVLLLTVLIQLLPARSYASLAAPPVTEASAVATAPPAVVPDRAALEGKLGRKLKFTERLALGIAKRKIKRQQKRAARGGGPVDVPSLLSLIFGVLGFLGVVLGVVSFFFALAALVLGIIGINRHARNPGLRTGRGMAIAGTVLGGVYMVILVAVLAIILIAFA